MSKQTEAERLADELEEPIPGYPAPTKLEADAAAELRRQASFINQLMDEVARLQKREWVGLSEQERNDLEDYCEMIIGKAAFDAIEAKLKEKNT